MLRRAEPPRRHHFWFLDIWLGHMHLRTLCCLIGATFLPALLLPGMVHSRMHGGVVGGLLVVQVWRRRRVERQQPLWAGLAASPY